VRVRRGARQPSRRERSVVQSMLNVYATVA
jgi:hypothetical protein